MTTASSFRASRAIGAMFFSLLGGVWLVLGSNRAFGLNPPVLALVVVGALVLFGFAWRVFQRNKEALVEDAASPAKKKADRVFNIVNAGQWILILALGNVLVNVGRPEWVLAAAMFIIGLHFLPLAHVFAYPPHYVTGLALMTWAVGYSLVAPNGPANPVGCLGAGVILWASAAFGLTVKPFGRQVQTQINGNE